MPRQPFGRRASGQGPIPDLILAADEVVRLRGEVGSVLSRHTGQSVGTLQADTDRDCILKAEATLGYGLVDQILTDRSDAVGDLRQASFGMRSNARSRTRSGCTLLVRIDLAAA